MRRQLLNSGAWFFLLVAVVAMCISVRYWQSGNTPTDLLTWVYLTVTIISHFALLAFGLFSLFYVVPILIFPNRKLALALCALIGTIGLSLLVLDTYIFDLYRFHINGFVLNLVFGGAFFEIFTLDAIVYFKAFLFLLLVILVMLFTAQKVFKRNEQQSFKHGRKISIAITLMLLTSHLIHAYAYAVIYKPILRVSLYYPVYFPLRANNFLDKTGIIKKSAISAIVSVTNDGVEKNILYPLHPLKCNPLSGKPNILLIVIDTWNYKTLSSVVMPQIAAFADTSLRFTNHYSGGNGTRPGIFSLFYGIPPVYWDDFRAEGIAPVFMDELQRQEYDLGIFASAPITSPEFDQTVFCKVKNLRKQTNAPSPALRDQMITQEWMDFIGKHQAKATSPFFGFLFYDCAHNYAVPEHFNYKFKPYWEQVDYSKLNNATDPTLFLNLYKNSLWFADSLVGNVLNDLSNKQLLQNTIVIITGDHGQEFNDNHHNYWGHNGNYSRAQIGVPMVAHFPERASRQYTNWTTHYDIVPALMKYALGCKNSAGDYSMGKDLLDTTERNYIFAGNRDEFAILEKDRINSVQFNGVLDITDTSLNELPNAKTNAVLMDKVMKEVKKFYK